jgi:DNA modification methylase
MINKIHVGDCRAIMRQLLVTDVRANCIVTSPPYWGLRDYGMEGQFGLERSWIRHVARMRSVFRLCREMLTPDGTLWLNYGDSYHSPRPVGRVGDNSTINGKRGQEEFRKASRARKSRIQPPDVDGPNRRGQDGLKPKDMVGMPWRIALALQDDGWYLRSDIIWHKPNPMPESIRDRPTKAHEYLFLLTKSEHYHYDAASIAEPVTGNSHPRGNHGINPKSRLKRPVGWAQGAGVSHDTVAHNKQDAGVQIKGGDRMKGFNDRWNKKYRQNESYSDAVKGLVETRNARTVWSIPTEATSFAHFATFPRELVRRCILAGSREGDIIFDPFCGSGTVCSVAMELGRRYLGCEINPEYAAMFKRYRSQQTGFAI